MRLWSALFGVVQALLLVLALYFIQEGQAQQAAAKTGVTFFVHFPPLLLPVAYAAAIVLIPTLAATILAVMRRAPLGRWPWIGTGIAVALLIILTVGVGGPDAVRTIVDPSH